MHMLMPETKSHSAATLVATTVGDGTPTSEKPSVAIGMATLQRRRESAKPLKVNTRRPHSCGDGSCKEAASRSVSLQPRGALRRTGE
jgi:hypothetical protein